MKLLIENFKKYLKEEQELDDYKLAVQTFTEPGKLRNMSASEIVKEMEDWIKNSLGADSWDESRAIEAFRESGFSIEDGESLESVFQDLIDDENYDYNNI